MIGFAGDFREDEVKMNLVRNELPRNLETVEFKESFNDAVIETLSI